MKCIDQLFDLQAERTPGSVAAVFDGEALTYRELRQRADEFAGRLRSLGVGPDVLVALYLERSLDMVVGLLGILKAGGAYVPLDPALPNKRLAYMLADANPPVLVTQARLRDKLPAFEGNVVSIDAPPASGSSGAPAADAVPARGPGDLAYVIYTSGSTGDPKGVEIEHRAVVNMLTSMRRRPGLEPEDTLLAITTLAFDISALEIFLPLITGARLVIASRETAADGESLSRLIAGSGATVLQATPATLRMLLEADWGGDGRLKILCGGEAWGEDLAKPLLSRCGSLWNVYGPTETTVWSAVAKVEADPPSIGKPIQNTRLYVLDGASQLVPVGVPGELNIGGEGLARGYRGRPELTRERFVADPFSEMPGARMYRTGDLVRRNSNGSLEFLGRLDHQVKIRGHRIELGEIETTLARASDVAQCVVVTREYAPNDIRLIAYVIPVAGAVIEAAKLRLQLSETLPGYMIPSSFVSVATFPLTPNGKIDRKALPAPELVTPRADVAVNAPRSATEEGVARIWSEILKLNHIGVRDDFFDVGGHSMLAAKVVGKINETFGVQLRVIAFFETPTIAAVAEMIERDRATKVGHGSNGSSAVVQLGCGAIGPRIYFIGAGPVEFHIGKMIGETRAVFATDVPLPPEWRRRIAGEDHPVATTIDKLGEIYGSVISEHAGSEPFVIAGYSFGAKLAFEAAHALQRLGSKVVCVVLVDGFAWSGYTRGTALRSWRWIWGRAPSAHGADKPHPTGLAALGETLRLARWCLAQTPRLAKSRLKSPSLPYSMFDHQGKPVSQTVVNRLALIAGGSFRPRPLDARGVLLRAAFRDADMLPGYDESNGWRHFFTRGLDVVEASGDHWSIVSNESNRAAVARQIDEVLDRVSLERFSDVSNPNSREMPALSSVNG